MQRHRSLGRFVFSIAILAFSAAPPVNASCGVPSLRDLARSADQLLIAEVEAHGRDANEVHSHVLLRTIETFKGSPPERQWVELAYGVEAAPAIRGERYLVALYKRATPLVFEGGSANLVLDACAMLSMRWESMPHRVRQLRRWGFFWQHLPSSFFERSHREPWLQLTYYAPTRADYFHARIERSGRTELAAGDRTLEVSLTPADLAQLRRLSQRDELTVGGSYGTARAQEPEREISVEGGVHATLHGRSVSCEDEDELRFANLWNDLVTATGSVTRIGTDVRLPPCRPGSGS